MKVAIVVESIRQYREPFYKGLKSRLGRTGIELLVVYGTPVSAEASKGDAIELDWGHKIRNRYFSFGRRTLTWQPCLSLVRDSDLIIVEQASRHLANYVLLARQGLGLSRIAFWGHGRNFQDQRASRFGEAIKRFVSRRVHWWFAYNDLSVAEVTALGFPRERVTSVKNAIDTSQLVTWRKQLSTHTQVVYAEQRGLNCDNLCVYSGSLYAEKRLDYLISACDEVRKIVTDFGLLVIGDGPQRSALMQMAQSRPWLHVVGPQFGEDKVRLMSLSKLFLLPGLVGLAVLDAFALEVPLVAVAGQQHSPEIDYLRPGVNGLLLRRDASATEYANAVAELLTNESKRELLIQGCRESREQYTIEEMVERFAAGIEAALA